MLSQECLPQPEVLLDMAYAQYQHVCLAIMCVPWGALFQIGVFKFGKDIKITKFSHYTV